MKTVLNSLKHISVAGTGSIGSYLCDNLLKGDIVEKLKIYEPDIVDEKNLKNSIYRKSDIGSLKIDALEKLFQDDRVEYYPVKYDDRYKDESFMIDCTDIEQEWLSDLRLSLLGDLLFVQPSKCIDNIRTEEYFIETKKSQIIALVGILISKFQDIKFMKSCITNKTNCFISNNSTSVFQSSMNGVRGRFINFYDIFLRFQEIPENKKIVFHIQTKTLNSELYMLVKSLHNQNTFYDFLNNLVKVHYTNFKHSNFHLMLTPDDMFSEFHLNFYPFTSTA